MYIITMFQYTSFSQKLTFPVVMVLGTAALQGAETPDIIKQLLIVLHAPHKKV